MAGEKRLPCLGLGAWPQQTVPRPADSMDSALSNSSAAQRPAGQAQSSSVKHLLEQEKDHSPRPWSQLHPPPLGAVP